MVVTSEEDLHVVYFKTPSAMWLDSFAPISTVNVVWNAWYDFLCSTVFLISVLVVLFFAQFQHSERTPTRRPMHNRFSITCGIL